MKKELEILIDDEQDVRMPRSTGMYESGLMYQLERLFQTRSTSPIPGLVRFLIHFCLVSPALATF